MRKLLPLISLLLLLSLLPSCKNALSPAQFAPERTFRRTFSLDSEGVIIEGEIQVYSDRDMRIRYASPNGLRFFSCAFDGEGIKTEVDSHEDYIYIDELPDNSPIKLLFFALRTFLFTNIEFTKDESGNFIAEEAILGSGTRAVFAPDRYISEIINEEYSLSIIFNT